MNPMTNPIPVVVHRAHHRPAALAARLFGQVGGLFITAWILMLVLGYLHRSPLPVVPALGYWTTFWVLYAVRLLPSDSGWSWLADARTPRGGVAR